MEEKEKVTRTDLIVIATIGLFALFIAIVMVGYICINQWKDDEENENIKEKEVEIYDKKVINYENGLTISRAKCDNYDELKGAFIKLKYNQDKSLLSSIKVLQI